MDRRLATGIVTTLVVFVSVLALAPVASASGGGYQGLMGKRIPGTNGTWVPIFSPDPGQNVAGTSTPPLMTEGANTNSVAFFEFPSQGAATKFATSLPLAVRLYFDGILRYQPTAEPVAAPASVRWYDTMACLGPAGEPTRYKLNASGTCAVGSGTALGSIGIAEVIQRGKVAVVIDTEGGSQILVNYDRAAAPSDAQVLSDDETLANGVNALMTKVGLKATPGRK